MADLEKKIEKPLRVLASELEKKGQMKGIIAEITSVLLKNIKEIQDEELQQIN